MKTLRGITWDHPRGYGPLAGTAKAYERERGVRVEWDKRSLRDFGDAPLAELAHHYDMLIIDHPHVGGAADHRSLCAMEELLPQARVTGLMAESVGPSGASYHYGNRTWALPLDAAHHVTAFRPDRLDEAPPTTWSGVLELARRLRRDGTPMALPLAPTDCICSFMTLCASQGSAPGQRDRWVDRETGMTSLKWLREAASLTDRQSHDWNPIQCLDHMAHADDTPYCPITFAYRTYTLDGLGRHPLHYVNIPGGRGALLGGAGFAVSLHSPWKREAASYGAWLCSAAVQSGPYLANGGQPANRAAWIGGHANASPDAFFASTIASLEQAYVRPRHPGFVDFQEWAGNAIRGFLDGDEGAEALLNRMDDAYHASLGESTPGGAPA